METLDLGTSEGIAGYVKTLSDDQLAKMAAITDPFKIVFAAAAEMELTLRSL